MIRADKVGRDSHLVTFKNGTGADLKNGEVVTLSALESDGNAYTGTIPSAVTDPIVIIDCPCNSYLPTLEKDWVLKALEYGRGRVALKGDIYTITDDCLTGTKATTYGTKIYVTAGKQLTYTAGSSPANTLFAKVIASDSLNGQTAIVIEIL